MTLLAALAPLALLLAAADPSRLPPSLSPAPIAPAPQEKASPAPAATGRMEVVVVDLTKGLITAFGEVDGLKPMQFGWFEDASGFTLGRVMIVRVTEKGLIATAVSNGDRVRLGTRLLFEPPPRVRPADGPAARTGAAPPPSPARP